jgi:transcription elongation factor Elf1
MMPRDHRGLRQPAPNTSPLPVLAAGRDAWPRRCRQCGSAFLEASPPLGHDRYGTLTCGICGTTLAFIESLPRSTESYRATLAAGQEVQAEDGQSERHADACRRSWYKRRA